MHGHFRKTLHDTPTVQRHIIWRFRMNGGSLDGKGGIGVKYEPADLEEALARMHSMSSLV